MIEYTVYNSEGHFVMAKMTSDTELPILSDGNVAVAGLHHLMTRLINNNVVEFSDEEKLEIATTEAADNLRSKRNKILRESDWIDLPNSSMSDTAKQDWLTYRQALRDLPSSTDVLNPVWPEPPQ
jgi:hypothetical protein